MFRVCAIALLPLFLLSACASGTFKARQELREKMAVNSGLYCEFINGDQHPDTDVELNMQMARRCDANRPFSITNYKNASDQIGVMYCCAMQGHEPKVVRRERPQQTQRSVLAPAQQQAPVVAPAATVVKPAETPKADESSDDIVEE
ncbi:MAG TPA: hypothetical protein VF412_01780 [Bdellovibrio sp.]|uniref:hypothetical protein n=1 Tax=Bdellovibrio sp. TaxID=28201 RepID=UPI002EFF20A1